MAAVNNSGNSGNSIIERTNINKLKNIHANLKKLLDPEYAVMSKHNLVQKIRNNFSVINDSKLSNEDKKQYTTAKKIILSNLDKQYPQNVMPKRITNEERHYMKKKENDIKLSQAKQRCDVAKERLNNFRKQIQSHPTVLKLRIKKIKEEQINNNENRELKELERKKEHYVNLYNTAYMEYKDLLNNPTK